MHRLGDILVEHGAIGRRELESLLQRVRGRMGAFLHAHDAVAPRALAAALAAQHGLPTLDLLRDPPDPALYQPHRLQDYTAQRYLPHRRDGARLTIACCDPSPALHAQLRREYGAHVVLAVISPRDFTHALAALAGSTLTRRARHQLRRLHRGLSASQVMLPHQRRGLLLLAIAITAAFLWYPTPSWHAFLVACNVFYLASLGFKLMLYWHGRIAAQAIAKQQQKLALQAASLLESALPVYSILVPLYRESANVMARLIQSLDALDYPREKLDIKLICEADDTATIAALRHLRPPQTMEIIPVPPSLPRTKPKACNVALEQIRGEFLVIYDAEDAPAADQLKKSVALFSHAGDDVACLQAPLNYYNRGENMLTKLFALEYSALFRLLLPALEHLRLPIPLGGTSNHLRVGALRAAGGWDAFNVTEDADLGVRLAYLGYRTRMLPSLTLEESPVTLRAWMQQRTRWIKGYLQTWLVYTRNPAELKRRLGAPAYYGFQFFIGAPALTFLLAPMVWFACLATLTGLLDWRIPPSVMGLCMASFAGGVACHVLFAIEVVRMEGWPRMRSAILLFPFYWLLHSWAALRAVWQLLRAPFYWAKTTHGVSRNFGAQSTVDSPPSRG